MRNLIFLALITILASCAKEDFGDEGGTPQSNGFTLKVSHKTSRDTVFVPINNDLTVYVENAIGEKVLAEFDFGNGNSVKTSNQAVDKYSAEGFYNLTATIRNVVPNVTLKMVVDTKALDVITETGSIVLLNNSMSSGTNYITLGLRCDVINNVDLSRDAEVQGEMPGANWRSYTLYKSDIVTVRGIKYFKWSFSCSNGKVRFGWLQGSNWAVDTKSQYRQSDGLYNVYVKDASIYSTAQ